MSKAMALLAVVPEKVVDGGGVAAAAAAAEEEEEEALGLGAGVGV